MHRLLHDPASTALLEVVHFVLTLANVIVVVGYTVLNGASFCMAGIPSAISNHRHRCRTEFPRLLAILAPAKSLQSHILSATFALAAVPAVLC